MAWASDTLGLGFFGEGRLAALGHLPVFLSIFLLKDATSSSADCSNAELFLNYAEGPLIFLTESSPTPKSTGERNGVLSTSWNGRCTVGGMAALLVGCMCAHKPTDRARIYQMNSMVLSGCGLPWRGWFFCVSVTQRKGRCSYELTKMNSQIGSQGVGMGTLLPLRHLWMSSSWRGGDQGQRQTPVRQPQANNESVVFL